MENHEKEIQERRKMEKNRRKVEKTKGKRKMRERTMKIQEMKRKNGNGKTRVSCIQGADLFQWYIWHNGNSTASKWFVWPKHCRLFMQIRNKKNKIEYAITSSEAFNLVKEMSKRQCAHRSVQLCHCRLCAASRLSNGR